MVPAGRPAEHRLRGQQAQLTLAKLGRASRCPGGRARCPTTALGSLPWTLPGLPAPWHPSFLCSDVGTQVRDVCARLMAQYVSPMPMLETKRQTEQVLDNSLLRGHSVLPPSPTADGEFRTARHPAASRALYLKQAEGTHTSPRFLRLEEGRGSFALLY